MRVVDDDFCGDYGLNGDICGGGGSCGICGGGCGICGCGIGGCGGTLSLLHIRFVSAVLVLLGSFDWRATSKK